VVFPRLLCDLKTRHTNCKAASHRDSDKVLAWLRFRSVSLSWSVLVPTARRMRINKDAKKTLDVTTCAGSLEQRTKSGVHFEQ
jgi:hypothetical protein